LFYDLLQASPATQNCSQKVFTGVVDVCVGAVACRGLVMPGATACLDAPYQIPVFVQWHIDGGHCYWIHSTLFVTSQCDVIFTFANQRFGEVCWHDMHIQGRRSSCRAWGGSKRVEGNGNL